MKSSDESLIKALFILSEDIQSEDGVANAAILEAAFRLKELAEKEKQNQSYIDNIEQIKQELAHIRSPYSLNQILDLYCKGDYSAELLLQHSLRILINKETQSHE